MRFFSLVNELATKQNICSQQASSVDLRTHSLRVGLSVASGQLVMTRNASLAREKTRRGSVERGGRAETLLHYSSPGFSLLAFFSFFTKSVTSAKIKDSRLLEGLIKYSGTRNLNCLLSAFF